MMKTKLLCIPSAAASAMMFIGWRRYMAKGIEIYPVELPGRGLRFRDSLINDMGSLGSDLLALVRPHIEEKSYAILGYCMGSIVCYELYRKIVSAGLPKPKHIFIAASAAPHRQKKRKSIFLNSNGRTEIQKVINCLLSSKYSINAEESNRFLERFINVVCEMDGNIDSVTDEQIVEMEKESGIKGIPKDEVAKACRVLITIFNNDSKMLHSYMVDDNPDKFDSEMTVFEGSNDGIISHKELLGWKRYAGKKFEIRKIDGDHLFLYEKSKEVINVINEVMD